MTASVAAGEFETKLERVRGHLAAAGARGALFASHAAFAWLTGGGRNHVNIAAERGVAAILATPDGAWLLADNIERRRLEEEELGGLQLEAREYEWWSGSFLDEALKLVPASELVTDVPLVGAGSFTAADLLALRNPLLPEEISRYRKLGEEVAVILTHVAFHCRPALTEHQLAGMLAAGLTDFGITPVVTLVAVDERVHTRRHPLPTDRRLERYALLVVGARRHGLNVSASRLVHFGPIPEEVLARHRACVEVDAGFLAATRPGVRFADIFRAGQEAYAAAGYPAEWKHHHQGGPTGYAERDLRVGPETPGEVRLHQAFAWNPTISGTKSEDTVLVQESGLEVLSRTPDLPELRAGAFTRAAILER
jgi:Xaa-Pro aminopeptidase